MVFRSRNNSSTDTYNYVVYINLDLCLVYLICKPSILLQIDGTSMTLMNSIWSSMANTDDSGPGDCFRLCNELSLEPKKNKKGCKKLKEKSFKTKSINPNEKIKKKKKCKEEPFEFVHEVKPKVKEGELAMKIKELSTLQEKEGVLKIKTEKIYEEIENLNAFQDKLDSQVQVEPTQVATSTMEDIRISIKKDLDAVDISQIHENTGNHFKELVQLPNAVSDVVKTIKLDTENEYCVINKQTNISNQRDIDFAVVSTSSTTQERDDHELFLNARSKTTESSLCTNYSSIGRDVSYVELNQSVSEPDLCNKTIDLDPIIESTVIKTETIDDNESCCVVVNDDDDEVREVSSQIDRIGGESLDVSKIAHEVEIGSDSVDVCVPEHIQNDRLDSLLESDITNYPTIPGSESFNASKDIQNDMQTSFSRDICIADHSFLQLPSFFEGTEDLVSQVLCDWPTHQGSFGLYKEHDNNYLPTVLLRSDINFGVLFPEVTIDNDEEEEEINYQAQGQYARGAKVAFGDMATVEENEAEWETRDQEYEESSPASRDESNRSVSEPSPVVVNNSLPMTVETESQSFVIEQSPPIVEEKLKKPPKISDNRTTYEINGSYDLSKFQQVSVNLKQVAYEIAEKPLTKGMLTPEAINLHDRTVFRDHYHFITQQKFRMFYLSKNSPATTPIPYPAEISPRTKLPVMRCPCNLCYANYMALIANFNSLTQYRNIRLKNDAELRKSQDEELLRRIEESLSDTKIIKKEEKDEKPLTESDASLPLKKRKAITNINLKQEMNESLNCKNTLLKEHIHSSSKRAKKIKKHKVLDSVCTKVPPCPKNNHSDYLKEENNDNDTVPINVPLMKVVYTSPEGNKLKVKTLAQRKETYTTPTVENLTNLRTTTSNNSEVNSDPQTKRSHRHHHRSKRSKQEKLERRERRRLKKLLKS